jgi:DNA-binding NarL/FixJ family response regulator
MTTISVILADDHPVVRTGIRTLLERAPDLVVLAEAESGQHALDLLAQFEPDVLVLDIEMPDISGLEVVNAVRERNLPVRVLALSAHADGDYVRRALQYGASGYLVKDEVPQMIVEAVRGIAMGEDGWLSRRAAARLGELTHREQQSGSLTPREYEVLELIVQGMTNQQIAHELEISESTVEKHVAAIYGKLGVESRVGAAVQAIRDGLL